MTTLEITLPDQVARELGVLVKDGGFASETEIVRMAVLDFIRHNQFMLAEQFQREDIAWALQEKKKQV